MRWSLLLWRTYSIFAVILYYRVSTKEVKARWHNARAILHPTTTGQLTVCGARPTHVQHVSSTDHTQTASTTPVIHHHSYMQYARNQPTLTINWHRLTPSKRSCRQLIMWSVCLSHSCTMQGQQASSVTLNYRHTQAHRYQPIYAITRRAGFYDITNW